MTGHLSEQDLDRLLTSYAAAVYTTTARREEFVERMEAVMTPHQETLDLFGEPLPENVLGEPVYPAAEPEAAWGGEPELAEAVAEAEAIEEQDFSLYGFNLFGEPVNPRPAGVMHGRFTWPPFSVLNTVDGNWAERKARWLALGIRSEEGRGDNLTYKHKNSGWMESQFQARGGKTSIFDPVLTELCYRWYCPEGGQILDPFAGGSVRGIVASLLGFRYWGSDLNGPQLEANYVQARELCPLAVPEWLEGDSRALVPFAPQADLIFTCPPYADLEVYSQHPADISAMEYPDFLAAYREIIGKAAARLRPDRFAVLVVGEVRGKDGTFRGFVPDTVRACEDAGLAFYNESILVNPCGTLPLRVTKQFEASRKVGKRHQNVLVFVKGSPRKATQAIRDAACDEA